MKPLILVAILLLSVLGLHAAPDDEIQELLTFVGSLKGAEFIRNGSTHTPAEAVNHLRAKWEKQREKVKTAEDFIEVCGSRSLTSGEIYKIRFSDRRERPSGDVLREELERIRKRTSATPVPSPTPA